MQRLAAPIDRRVGGEAQIGARQRGRRDRRRRVVDAQIRQPHQPFRVARIGIGRFHQVAGQEIVDRRKAGRLRVAERHCLHRREPQGGELQGGTVHAELGKDQDMEIVGADELGPARDRQRPAGQTRKVLSGLLGHVVGVVCERIAEERETLGVGILDPALQRDLPDRVARDEGTGDADADALADLHRRQGRAGRKSRMERLHHAAGERTVGLLQAAVVVPLGRQIERQTARQGIGGRAQRFGASEADGVCKVLQIARIAGASPFDLVLRPIKRLQVARREVPARGEGRRLVGIRFAERSARLLGPGELLQEAAELGPSLGGSLGLAGEAGGIGVVRCVEPAESMQQRGEVQIGLGGVRIELERDAVGGLRLRVAAEIDRGAQLGQRLSRASGRPQHVAELETRLRVLRLEIARAAIGRDGGVEPPVDLQREAEIAIGAACLLDRDRAFQKCDAAGDIAALTAHDAAHIEHGAVVWLDREDLLVQRLCGREFFGLVVTDRALEIAPGLVVACVHLRDRAPHSCGATISRNQPASFKRGNFGSKRERKTAASSGSAKQ